jgi:hypothetical protein
VLDFHYQVVQLNRLDWQQYLRHPNPLASALLAKMHIPRRERCARNASVCTPGVTEQQARAEAGQCNRVAHAAAQACYDTVG